MTKKSANIFSSLDREIVELEVILAMMLVGLGMTITGVPAAMAGLIAGNTLIGLVGAGVGLVGLFTLLVAVLWWAWFDYFHGSK